jgi:hypothetical protein
MASSKFSLNIDTEGLELLKKNLLEANKYYIAIGILDGEKNTRDDGNTNAGVGAVHEQMVSDGMDMEYGSKPSNLPRRSFLLDPLSTWYREALLEYLKSIQGDILNKMTIDKGIIKIYNRLGNEAKKCVQDAFDTGGKGNWQALSDSTIKRKGNSDILVDTSQLRNSISFRVKKGE